MPDDLPELEDYKDDIHEPMKTPSQDVQLQLGSRPDVVRDGSLIVYRKHLGWCVVIEGRMTQLRKFKFMRVPLGKPSPEVQAKVVFDSLSVSYDPNSHS